jgi:hypothetical protein
LDHRLFNRAIRALNPAISATIVKLGEAVLGAGEVKNVAKGPGLMAHVAELNAIVCQYGMCLI